MLAGAGCSSTGPKNVDKFVGDWTFSQGSFVATCPPPVGMIPSSLVGQTMTLTAGSGSDLMSTLHTAYGDCTLKLSVDGTKATATPNQTCNLTVTLGGVSVPATLTVTSWTLTSGNTGGADNLLTAATGTAATSFGDCTVTVDGLAGRSSGGNDASAG